MEGCTSITWRVSFSPDIPTSGGNSSTWVCPARLCPAYPRRDQRAGVFPRPDLHERLIRAIEKTKPDLVFACYGMNDGIYFPLSDERFAAFKGGMQKLHQHVESAHIRI